MIAVMIYSLFMMLEFKIIAYCGNESKYRSPDGFIEAGIQIFAERNRCGIFTCVDIIDAEHPFAFPVAVGVFVRVECCGNIEVVVERQAVPVAESVARHHNALVFIPAIRIGYRLSGLQG